MPTLELLELAVDAAEEAGRHLLRELRRERIAVETKSTGTDMVSEVDRAAERMLVEHIVAARADDAILGEEGAGRPGTSGVSWTLDPIDGTTNYLYGFPAFAVSVGVAVDGVPSVGVVHDPLHAETFAARRGHGATCNGEPIRPSATTDLGSALVGTGFSYRPEQRAWQAVAVSHLLPRVRDIRRAGAAALDLCWVACGRLDATYERGLQVWDHAAGALIVLEAGGTASVEVGAPWARVTSSCPGIADAFEALTREAEELADRAVSPRPT